LKSKLDGRRCGGRWLVQDHRIFSAYVSEYGSALSVTTSDLPEQRNYKKIGVSQSFHRQRARTMTMSSIAIL
jgi:CRP-like cAMP-binding protein